MPNKSRTPFILLCFLIVFGCRGSGSKSGGQVLTAEVPLHLENHLDAARIEGCEIPKDVPPAMDWRFDKDQPGWKAAVPFRTQTKPPQLSRIDDALRITLTKENRSRHGDRYGHVYTDLPDWNRDDWSFIIVRARTTDEGWLEVDFNLRDKPGDNFMTQNRFLFFGDYLSLIPDGEVHSYLLRTSAFWPEGWDGSWKQLGIEISSGDIEPDDSGKGPMSYDILSVSVIPKEMDYAKSRAGTSIETWGKASRRTLYAHVPGKLEFPVKVPEDGRLDFGFGLLKKNVPVKFRISVRDKKTGTKTLVEETCAEERPVPIRSVDLSGQAGKNVTLVLETEAGESQNVAFWTAPTVTGRRTTEKPNVIFYVIDAGAADLMSVHGYNRRTTPNLERLAAEGAVFEHAFSNSPFTDDSVPSFMTSLQSSVLGNTEGAPLPEQALTMAQQMHRAGYQTEVLTSNPYCGRASGLDRGVDALQDSELGENVAPSKELNEEFWNWRQAYPGEPYWVHFQPTDVHIPWKAIPPFAGLYVDPEIRPTYEKIIKQLLDFPGGWEEKWDSITVDHAKFAYAARSFYDETMAQLDYEIGQLAESLKTAGEWDHTLFIVAADHGHYAGGLPILDPPRPKWETPLFARQKSHVPMIFIWPGKIAPGQRFSQPVSMIDVLPTILDLAGMPLPEVMQGQSLAPLLLGKPGYTPRPVVFDEFTVEGKHHYGSIEVVDGRWGASLSIDPRPDDQKTPRDKCRPAPLLLFDIWDDPYCVKSLHQERPDLVEKYSKMLDEIWKEHRELAKKFTRTGEVLLTPDQIETLRSLGYLH